MADTTDNSDRTTKRRLKKQGENDPADNAERVARRRISDARRRPNQRTLDLSGLGLKTLPPEIVQLTALQALHLDNNQLSALPSEIVQLTALQELYLNNNQFSALPPEITQLTALEGLSLTSNQLTALPPEIAQLTALEQLYLANNQLTALPPEIAQLTALQELDLSHNQLTALPHEIGQLRALEKVFQSHPLLDARGLWIEQNPLRDPYPRLIAPGQPEATINVLSWLRGELDPATLDDHPIPPPDHDDEEQDEPDNSDDLNEAMAQRPAAFRFGLRNGKIDTLPERPDVADLETARDLYAELKAKTETLRDRLERTNSDQRAQGSVGRLLDALGARLQDVRPGVLLSRSRSIEADRNAFNTPKARRELFPEAIAMMDDVLLSLEDLLAVFPIVREIEAEQIALAVQRDAKAIKTIRDQSDAIKQAAGDSPAVSENSVKALKEHDADIDAARNNTIRARLLADHLLVVRNFVGETLHAVREAGKPPGRALGDGIKKAGSELKEIGGDSWREFKKEFPKGVGEAGRIIPKAALVGLLIHLLGPVAGLAVFSKSFKQLAKAAKKLSGRGQPAEKTKPKKKSTRRATPKRKPQPTERTGRSS